MIENAFVHYRLSMAWVTLFGHFIRPKYIHKSIDLRLANALTMIGITKIPTIFLKKENTWKHTVFL